MGMFDYVNYSAKCSYCGVEITEWQSKDGPCALKMLEPKDVRTFYAYCGCKVWNEYNVIVKTYEVQRVDENEIRK